MNVNSIIKKAKEKDWNDPLTNEEIVAVRHMLMEKLLDDDEKKSSGNFLLRILTTCMGILQKEDK